MKKEERFIVPVKNFCDYDLTDEVIADFNGRPVRYGEIDPYFSTQSLKRVAAITNEEVSHEILQLTRCEDGDIVASVRPCGPKGHLVKELLERQGLDFALRGLVRHSKPDVSKITRIIACDAYSVVSGGRGPFFQIVSEEYLKSFENNPIAHITQATDAQTREFVNRISGSELASQLSEKYGSLWMESYRAPGYRNTIRLSDGHEWSACVKRNEYPVLAVVRG